MGFMLALVRTVPHVALGAASRLCNVILKGILLVQLAEETSAGKGRPGWQESRCT